MGDWDQMALAAKTDERQFNLLVETSGKWILQTAAQATHRYLTESDDEWSVALMAFDEAVRGYDETKGSFRAFAAVVIKRRVVDYLRSEGRHDQEVSVTPGAFEGAVEQEELSGVDIQVGRKIAADAMTADGDGLADRTREEIAGMQAILKEYGFSFFDLAECSPKAEKTKKSCAQAVRCLIASVILMAKMRLARLLPVKDLSRESGVVRKILDRHRRYIIAAAEILDGEFPILAGYMDFIRKG